MNLQTQCTNSPIDNEPLNPKKPFRSELNLVLSYPPNPDTQSSPSSSEVNQQITPPLPTPMELLTPLNTHTNPLFLQNLPSPYPSPIPASPLTPPMNFNTNDAHLFEKAPDYSHLKFPPINSPLPIFASDNSIFCTVSAPSTPASDRKCIEKFCANEPPPPLNDKKKAKRVSIVNSKDEASEKVQDNSETNADGKESDKKPDGNLLNAQAHHGHRSHSHAHIHKRRMSLDNNLVSSFKYNRAFILNSFCRTPLEQKITVRLIKIRTQKSIDESQIGQQILSKNDRGQTARSGMTIQAVHLFLKDTATA